MEDILGILICMGIFALLLLLPVWIVIYLRRSHALHKAGARYHGYVRSATLLSAANLRFDHGHAPVTVRFRRMGAAAGGKQTEVRILTPIRGIKFEAVCQMGKSRFWASRRNQQWTAGHEAFDHQFAVTTNEGPRMDRLLSAGVRWQMLQLAGAMTPGLYCSLFTGELIIAKPGVMLRAQELDDFIRLSLELFDQLMLAEAVGIEFDSAKASIIDDVNCPVCLAKIEDTMVLCVRCRTPHCHECWQYNGKCATFACDETRFVAPAATDVQ